MKNSFTKIVCMLLAAVMLLSVSPRAAADTALIGDINGDGAIDSDDAIYLLRHTLYESEYPVESIADLDSSGAVDSDDAIYLLRYTLFSAKFPLPSGRKYKRSSIKLSKMVYERPDFDSALEVLQSGLDSLQTYELTARKLVEVLNDTADKLKAFEKERNTIAFLYSRDVSDAEVREEYAYFNTMYERLSSGYLKLIGGILNSGYRIELFYGYSDKEREKIRKAALPGTDEYASLVNRYNELGMIYDDILSYSVVVDGEEIALGDIEDPETFDSEYNGLCADIYLEIISIMRSLAQIEEYDNVLDFMYTSMYGRDYTPDDARSMIEYVKRHIAPMLMDAWAKYEGYNVEIESVFDYDEQLSAYFGWMSDQMLEAYDYLKEFGLYYGTDSPNAAGGAYTCYMNKYDAPVIYSSLTGDLQDLVTFIHEFGHFFSIYFHGARVSQSLDVCEIHSQANELLFLPVYSEIFGETAGEIIQKDRLILSMYYLVQACIFSEFEMRAFDSDCSSYEDLCELFGEIAGEFGAEELFRPDMWTEVGHFFKSPHYYVSYATSLVPSLDMYFKYVEDRDAGGDLYDYAVLEGTNTEPFHLLINAHNIGYELLASPFNEENYIELAQCFAEALSLNE